MPIDLLGPASAPGAVTQRPTDNREFGLVDTWFQPCSSPRNQDGTLLQSDFMNGLLAQLRYALRASGIDLDNEDSMLWRAILAVLPEIDQVAQWHQGAATGTASTLSATLDPPITSYEDRLPVFLTFPNGVASGATIALNGLARIPIQRNDGSAIVLGDLPPGTGALFHTVSSGALRLASFGRGEVQIVVINPVLWVRTDGSDANDGLANTAGRAFRTVEAAVAAGTSRYSYVILDIRLGNAGRHAAPGTLPRGTGTIRITGDAANQAGYILSGAGTPGTGVVQANGPLTLVGVTVENTGTQGHTVAAPTGAVIILLNVTLLATVGTTLIHAFTSGGSITVATGCIIRGNAASAFGNNGGEIVINPNTVVTIQGNPTFSFAFAQSTLHGKLVFLAGASVSGAAVGRRYFVDTYAIISTNGGGETFLPGTIDGIKNTGIYQ